MKPAIELGVNIDHVATIREARGTRYPDPVQAAYTAVDAGADSITVHLREDRRHIQERDVRFLNECLTVPLNLEMAATPSMLAFALEVCPEKCCIVPEKREELTTEGGLDVIAAGPSLTDACRALQAAGIEVSLFIDPVAAQISAAAATGAPVVELHTGNYADAETDAARAAEFEKIVLAASLAARAGLQVNAGHGLHYQNVARIAAIEEFGELNIGHAIVARALFSGFADAVREMKRLLVEARSMIYGIGVDIVEVVRIERAYTRWGLRFAEKILGTTELQQFENTRRPVRFLAMRFAAKEAASKAFGTGFKQGVSPRQIEVQHNRAGKPSLVFSHNVAALAAREGIRASFVSMADETEYAIAYAVLEHQGGNE